MVAEKGSRRKGIASEALTLFMAYTFMHLVRHLFVSYWLYFHLKGMPYVPDSKTRTVIHG